MIKKLIYIAPLIFLGSCFLVVKQQSEEVIDFPVVPPKEIVDSTIYSIQYGNAHLDSSIFQLEYHYYRQARFPWQDSVNRQIGEFVSMTANFEQEEMKLNVLNNDFFRKQLQVFLTKANEIYNESEYKTLWTFDVKNTIKADYEKIARLTLSSASYTGGAHVNLFTENIYFSKESGKRLKLSDFVSDTLELNRIAEMHFRLEFGLKPEEDLNEAEFWFPEKHFICPDNFTFTDQEFRFYYNPYEIGPFYLGAPEFSVPLNEISHLLHMELLK